jgi:AbrB family looped-hinge helix DNA binding protein
MSIGLATTKLSSKGQVVIPEEVRNSLGLKTGDQFIVIGKGDAVILKTISEPSFDQFEELLIEAQKQAKKAGLKKNDIKNAIEKVRKRS